MTDTLTAHTDLTARRDEAIRLADFYERSSRSSTATMRGRAYYFKEASRQRRLAEQLTVQMDALVAPE